MSATNSTTNYSLPLFIPTDKPAWLVDWNGAMSAIDTAIKQAQTAADIAGTDIGTLQGDIVSINAALTSVNSAVSQLRIDTNANTGNINTINSLIGNGEPTTTDKTIIGAINEINSEVNNALNASLDEVVIGTWTDGSSLYRKAISTTSPATAGTISNVYTQLASNINIKKLYGIIKVSDAEYPVNSYIASGLYVGCFRRDANNIGMRVESNTMQSCPVEIVIEYTKTV